MAETLPDRWVDLPAPTQPSDLDGWTDDDMRCWLPPAAQRLAEAENRTEEMRVVVGLVLWRVLHDGGERTYGEMADMVARAAGVTVATLTRWRSAAEKQFQLPAPSKRTSSQRERKRDELTRQTRKSSPGQDDTQEPEVQPAPTQGRGSSPRADGIASPRGAQPPDPPSAAVPEEEPTANSFLCRQPTTREDYRLLIALAGTAGADVLAHNVERDALMVANRAIVGAVSKIDGKQSPKVPATKKAPPPTKTEKRMANDNFKKSMTR